MSQWRRGLLCIGVLGCVHAVAAADWPQWRGPERDGKSDETGLIRDWSAQSPALEWMIEGMGRGYASVSVVGGRLFTTGNFDGGQGVVAVDVESGSVAWRKAVTPETPEHRYEGSRCTPTVDGDHLYVVTSDGEIACLQAADGEIVWQRNFDEWQGRMMSGWGFSESPLVDGEVVVCTPGGRDAMLVALNKLTGEEVWRSAAPDFPGRGGKQGAGYSSIVVTEAAGVRQYVQLIGGGLIGVRADDGQFLWGYGRIANGTANIPTPLISGDYVFTSTGYQTGAALLRLQPSGEGVAAEEVYFLGPDTFQNHHGQMILKDGYVYAGHQHGSGLPICVELESGDVAWGGDIRGAGNGSAAVTYADGNLIFRYQNGTIALIEATPEEYRLKGTLRPEYQEDRSWAHPVVVDGKLYLREQDKLMCYRVAE